MLFNSDLFSRLLAFPSMARTEVTRMYEMYILLLTHLKTSNQRKEDTKKT